MKTKLKTINDIEGTTKTSTSHQTEGKTFPEGLPTAEERDALIMQARQLQAREWARLTRLMTRAVVRLVRRALAALVIANSRSRLRHELMSLDNRTLSDIGINRAEIPQILRDTYPWPWTQPAAQPSTDHVHRLRVPRAAPATPRAANHDRPRAA